MRTKLRSKTKKKRARSCNSPAESKWYAVGKNATIHDIRADVYNHLQRWNNPLRQIQQCLYVQQKFLEKKMILRKGRMENMEKVDWLVLCSFNNNVGDVETKFYSNRFQSNFFSTNWWICFLLFLGCGKNCLYISVDPLDFHRLLSNHKFNLASTIHIKLRGEIMIIGRGREWWYDFRLLEIRFVQQGSGSNCSFLFFEQKQQVPKIHALHARS